MAKRPGFENSGGIAGMSLGFAGAAKLNNGAIAAWFALGATAMTGVEGCGDAVAGVPKLKAEDVVVVTGDTAAVAL